MIERRRDIQVLRGLAVTAVVLFHAAASVFPNGYLGVDAFFVISGFVVTPLLVAMLESSGSGGKYQHLGRFLNRRVRRLMPALGTALLGASLLLILLTPIGADQADAAKLGLTAVGLGANFGAYAFAGDYFQHTPNPLIHTWSLSVEEQIYLLLPISLALTLGRNRLTPRALVFVTLLVVSVASLTITIALGLNPTPLELLGIPKQHATSFLYYATTSRVWEFGLGGLVVLLPGSFAPSDSVRRRLAAVTALMLAAWLFHLQRFALPFPAAEAGAAVFTAITLYLSTGTFVAFSWPLHWLGDRSYSIYLWHMPLIVAARYSPVISARHGGWLTMTLAVVASVIAGAISFSWVEQRYRTRGESTFGGPRLLTLVLMFAVTPALALTGVGLAARSQFWGVAGAQAAQAPAWRIDQECERMNHPGFEPCWYGPAGGDLAMLVGDSHAAALSQSFVDVARAAGMRAGVQTRSFCPLIDDEVLAAEDSTRIFAALSPGCRTHNRKLLTILRQVRLDVLVVTSRSTAGYGYLIGADGDEFFRSAVEKSLLRVRDLVDMLVIVGPVAEFPNVNFGHALLPRASTSPLPSVELPQQPFEDERRLKALATLRGIGYVSAIDAVCRGSFCAYDDYFDMTHLGLRGARLLEPALGAALARARSRGSADRAEQKHVGVEPRYLRPAEVDHLIGDAIKSGQPIA